MEPVKTLPSNADDTQQLVFIDSAVEDSQTLIDNISGATEVVVLDSSQDELVQISQHLDKYQDLDAVHIVSHGESGQLSFANATLNSDTLPEYKQVLEDWSLALDEEADLLLYGCDVADGDGDSLVRDLSQITDADVSASVDDTGINGDWSLEASVGEVEATSVFNSKIDNAYQHNLQDTSISSPVDGGGSISDDDNATLDAFDDQVNNELSGGGDDDDDDNSGDGDISFTGAEFFDEDFYLKENPGVDEAGSRRHYDEFGWKEGRDPNETFDTSFYLEQNPDVADAGINPFEHFHENAESGEPNRYPNKVIEAFGESEGALVASADLSNSQFKELKTLAEDTNEVALVPAIPFIIIGGAKVIAITAASIGIIKAASNIQDLLEDSRVEVFVPEGVDTSTGPFDLGEAARIAKENFPGRNDFLEDLFDGQYEFPDDSGEAGAYFLPIETNPILSDLIDSSTLGDETKGRTTQYDNDSGGFERANEIFDSLDLKNVGPLKGSNFNGRKGTLDDGRQVVVRDGSSSPKDEPTLEIQKGKNRTKFRFSK